MTRRPSAPLLPLLALSTLPFAFAAPAGAELAPRSHEAVGKPERVDPAVDALMRRFKDAQASTKTMTADFKQVKNDDVFAKPSVQTGHFYFTHPESFRWDYEVPDHVIVLMTHDKFQRYLPAQHLVRELDISKNRRRVFSNYFGIGSDVENLRRHFDLTVSPGGDEQPGSQRLDLRGKRRRVQKRLQLVQMWIDDKTSLPAAIKLTMADGGSTLWQFTNMKVNAPLAADTYAIQFPKGTVVQSETNANSPILDEMIEEDAAPGAATPASGATPSGQ